MSEYICFVDSTHQDTSWCALSIVYSVKKQLSTGFDIVPARLGTDYLERSFSSSRSKNSHATAQGTDGQMANIGGAVLQNLAKSRKANTGKETVFMSAEVDELKVPRRSSKRKRKHK